MTVHAGSVESAQEMLAALHRFRAELVEVDGGGAVAVTLGSDNGEFAAVLSAIQRYVTERADGPARVDFNGHRYVMHREPPEPGGL